MWARPPAFFPRTLGKFENDTTKTLSEDGKKYKFQDNNGAWEKLVIRSR